MIDVLWDLPKTLAATDCVRRWDWAIESFLGAFLASFLTVGWVLSQFVTMPVYSGLYLVQEWLIGGGSAFDELTRFDQSPRWAGYAVWAQALFWAYWAFWVQIQPRTHLRHVSGLQLLEGSRADEAAQVQSDALLNARPTYMYIHPDLPLPKSQWTRHGFVYGSVGSGKTVILSGWAQQIMDLNIRAFIWDPKGDYTQYFGDRSHARILCPWDDRSLVWDISADLDSPDRARAFANGLVPSSDGKDQLWNQGAADIIFGVILSLINEHRQEWGWRELARRLMLPQPDLYALLDQHHSNASRLVCDPASTSTASMLMNLSSHIRMIVDLAKAWPEKPKDGFSWRQWVRKKGKIRQIIVQPGPDSVLTAGLVAAMVNVIVDLTVSPETPDDEEGRSLFFLFDELSSIGKFDLAPLIDKGRSKGCMVWAGLQDLAQLRQVYGEDQAKALASMVGTHVVCQVQMGQTRNDLAELFGYRRVMITLPGKEAEDKRCVIDATDLTSKLGVRYGDRFSDGFGVRAIVSLGQDPLLLEWPGVKRPKPVKARIPAVWQDSKPIPDDVAQNPLEEWRRQVEEAISSKST